MTERPLRRELIAAMGLSYDPLTTSVSESDPAPDFGEIYVDPHPSLLTLLKRAISTLVFADYGMGKTATRLALEFELRNAYETPPALCVTYTPSGIDRGDSVLAQHRVQHLSALATETSIDLIIQLIERLSESTAPLSELQDRALRRLAQALPYSVRRRMRYAVEAAKRNELKNGAIWGDIRATSHGIARTVDEKMNYQGPPGELRAVVRHVAVTPQWQALIQHIITVAGFGPSRSLPWEQVVADVRALGFSRIFILIDAVDEAGIDREELYTVVKPLLDSINYFQAQDVFLKCFLPTDLEALIRTHDQPRWRGLTLPVEIANIDKTSPEYLQAIINERLHAAGLSNASFRSLDWLKGPDIESSIQAHLAELARGSPRSMIESASLLFDFHSLHGFKEERRLWLTAAEWRDFLRSLELLSQPPP